MNNKLARAQNQHDESKYEATSSDVMGHDSFRAKAGESLIGRFP